MDGEEILKFNFVNFKSQIMKYDKKLVMKAKVEEEIVELMESTPTAQIKHYEEELIKKGYEGRVVRWCLKDIDNLSKKKREELIKESKEVAEAIYAFSIGGDTTKNKYTQVYKSLNDRKWMAIQYKLVIYYFAQLLDRRLLSTYGELMQAMTCVTAKHFMREFIDKMAMSAGIKVYNDTSYMDLKSALKLSQTQLRDYENHIDKNQKNEQQKYIAQFLSALNEDDQGNLLNELSKCNEKILELEAKGYVVPEELQSMMVLIKGLARFLKNYGITAVTHKKHFITTKQELDDCIYYGDPFMSDEDKRDIEVKSPGWRYKESIISKPVYMGKKVIG